MPEPRSRPPHVRGPQPRRHGQPLASSQRVPLGLAGLLQAPVVNEPATAEMYSFALLHTTAFEPTQTPAWQASVCVQALASSQRAPLGWAGLLQAPDAGSQVPAVW